MTAAGNGSKVVGRADLVRALASRPSPNDERFIATCLGFGREAGDDERTMQASSGGSTVSVPTPPPVTSRPSRPPTRFWQVVEVVSNDQPELPPQAVPLVRPSGPLSAQDFRPMAVPPPSRRLVSWARLRRVMEELCRRPRPIGDVDVDVVVDRIGRGLPIERIPRRPRRVRPTRVLVVIDRADRLIPFWGDQGDVYWNLRDELGAEGFDHRWWPDGPPLGANDEELVAAVCPGLEAGDIVLVLGDLGHYGAKLPRERISGWSRAWVRLGEALSRYGVTAAALLPVPATRWEPDVVRAWRAIDWAEPTRTRAEAGPGQHELDLRRDRLLALVSWTQRLEPGLLREARLCVPEAEADVGTEADVWCYEKARLEEWVGGEVGPDGSRYESVQQHAAGLLLPDAVRREQHGELQALLATRGDLVRRVVGCVRRYHGTIAREAWLDEARGLLSLDTTEAARSKEEGDGGITEEEQQEVLDFTQRVRAYLECEPGVRESLGKDVDLQGWLRMFLEGQPKEAWSHPQWGDSLGEIWGAVVLDGSPVPPGLDVSRLRSRPEGVEVRRFVVAQVGGELHVGVEGGAVEERGSPLVTVAARGRWIVIGGQRYVLEEEGVRRIALPEGDAFEIATDCVKKVELRLRSKPAWARGMRRDRQGLRVLGLEWAHEYGEVEFGAWATLRVEEVPPPEQGASHLLELNRLVRFFQQPAAELLKRRLGINLSEWVRDRSDREPTGLDSLKQWQAGTEILEHRLDELPALRSRELLRAMGLLPLGAAGDSLYEAIALDADPVAAVARRLRIGARLPNLAVDLSLPTLRLVGQLDLRWPAAVVRAQYGLVRAKHLLEAWIRHLTLCALAPSDQALRTVVVGRSERPGGVRVCWLIPVDNAREHLDELARLYVAGQQRPLYLFPRSSLAYAKALCEGKDDADARMVARNEWTGRGFAENSDPHLAHIFGDLDPLAEGFSVLDPPLVGEDFASLARRVFMPLLGHLQEGEEQ